MSKVIDTSVKIDNFEQLVRVIQWFEKVAQFGEYAYTLFGLNLLYDQPAGNYYFISEHDIWVERLADDDVAGIWVIYIDYSVPGFPIEHVFRTEDNRVELNFLIAQTDTTCIEQGDF